MKIKQKTIGERIAEEIIQFKSDGCRLENFNHITFTTVDRTSSYLLRSDPISIQGCLHLKRKIAQAIDAGIKEALDGVARERLSQPIDNNIELIENQKKRIWDLENQLQDLQSKLTRWEIYSEENARFTDAITAERNGFEEQARLHLLTIQGYADERFNYMQHITRLEEALEKERGENDILVNRTPLIKDIMEKLDKNGHVTIRYRN